MSTLLSQVKMYEYIYILIRVYIFYVFTVFSGWHKNLVNFFRTVA
jgi:hypothetical protein